MALVSREDTKRRRIQQLEEQQRELQRRLKQVDAIAEVAKVKARALSDFYFFCQSVMGFRDLYEPLHRPLCELIANETIKRKLILLPRGHFKSTIISIAYPLWLLCRDQNERIALCSVAAGKSMENLEEIVDRARRNRFQAVFGDTIGLPDDWVSKRADKVRVHREGSSTGPSIAAYGTESSEVGRHFSRMLLDDICDQETVNTELSRDKIWSWFGRQLSVLDPNCELIVIATRWHWDDPYSRIQKHLKCYTDDEKVKIQAGESLSRKWWVEKRAVIENGRIIFPTRFSREELEEIKKVQGDYVYSCFYYNEPVGEGINPFDIRKFAWVTETDLERYEPGHADACQPNTIICVDPAATEQNYSCYWGIVICDCYPADKVVIKEAILEKMHPDRGVDLLFQLVTKHRPVRVAIEDEAFQRSLFFWLRREMAQRNQFFSCMPLRSPRNVGKYRRMLALQPFLHNGDIAFLEDMPGRGELLEEFETYPKGPHTDLMSAMAMIPHAAIYPGRSKFITNRGGRAKQRNVIDSFLDTLVRREDRRRRGRMPRVRVKASYGL